MLKLASSRMRTPPIPAISEEFKGSHETTTHSAREYVRGDDHSNTIEGFFSIVKRGGNGIYHAVSKEHLHRYLAEFEFRYNHRRLDDGPRTVSTIKASEGKWLTYNQREHLCLRNIKTKH